MQVDHDLMSARRLGACSHLEAEALSPVHRDLEIRVRSIQIWFASIQRNDGPICLSQQGSTPAPSQLTADLYTDRVQSHMLHTSVSSSPK